VATWHRAELGVGSPLRACEVDVWWIDLDAPDDGTVPAADLSSDEERRARRFRVAADARRWSASRVALRRILATYLGIAPSEIGFTIGVKGKPILAGALAGKLHFNLSHSTGVALVAVSADHEVGVDVERVRAGIEEVALARFALAGDDVELLETCVPDRRLDTFFRLWVRHEACAKCRGTGLEEARREPHGGIVVDEVPVGDGYAAACAVAIGSGGSVR